MVDHDAVREFLIESNENLAKLDRELVLLEQHPDDSTLTASIFRTIHTIKGTSGFFGFAALGSITHIAESILCQLRDKRRQLTPEIVSLILETVDAVKVLLTTIETNGTEGPDIYDDLKRRLEAACKACGLSAAKSEAAPNSAPSADGPEQVAAATAAGGVVGQANPSSETVPPSSEVAPHQQEVGNAIKTSTVGDSTIRVDVLLLDKLMNLVGELVLARNQILQVSGTQNTTFNGTSQRLDLITTELQESVMKTRMQPIGVVWDKLPRVVRDLAASCGKKIQLEMDGAETELDKTIIEAIKDPLTHIVRNSCDHGIERPEVRVARKKNPQGRLALRAFHEGGHVIVEIADDGAGIDSEKIKAKAVSKGLIRREEAAHLGDREAMNLVFLPGLSTAEKVSSVSGRGVGMDVVKTNVEKIGGSVDLSSKPGEGTTIRIKIPLTLAIIPGLVVTLKARQCASSDAEERFVIPQANLLELIRLEGPEGRKKVEDMHGALVYRRRGKLLPLIYLRHALDIAECDVESDVLNIIVLQAEDRQFGLIVDGINDTQEIVVKPLGKQLKALNCYAGASIMGNGRVALILDVPRLAQRAGVISEIRDRSRTEQAEKATQSGTAKTTFLVFAGSGELRLAVPLDRVARLEELPVSKIEKAGTQWVAQYRGEILPIVDSEIAMLQKRKEPVLEVPSEDSGQGRLQVVVCNHDSHQVGLIAERIVDIVSDDALPRHPATRPGILYAAVINGQVTEIIDIPSLLKCAGVSFLTQTKQNQAPAEAAN